MTVVKSLEPVVVFGAGSLGRRVGRAVGAKMFCDNNTQLWGTSIHGIPVESPANAVRQNPDATFAVAIWNPSRTETMLDRVAALKALGAVRVIPFSDVLSQYGDQILPNLLWAKPSYYSLHASSIAEARSLFDTEGRAEFDRQLRLRHGDFEGQVIDPGVQYFPPEIQLGESEVFVDCGAYDGDTVREFRRATGDRFKSIIAFEPDPVNIQKLQTESEGMDRLTIHPYAVGARQETLRFTTDGVASRFSDQGECEVQVTTLDEALGGATPTYMKFDIEGSELDALKGGREIIRRARPNMAVCLYHVPDHLWSIPLTLHDLLPDSRFTMRTYYADGFECVCYCIPN